jgi:hypothetical protein
MAEFARGEAAEASSSPLDYACAPRLLTRGTSPSGAQALALASYPWVSPDDGRTRHRIILTHVTRMGSQAGLIVYETGPLDWSLEPVLFLDRNEMERRNMYSDYRDVNYNFQAGLDVKAVEVPDPVAEGEGEGRRGGTVILVATEKGMILAFHGESLDFMGAVNRKKGFVRRLTPYYAEAGGSDGGARRLRVVASGKGPPCVWDFTEAPNGGWEMGLDPGVLMQELEMAEEGEDPMQMVLGAAYYATSDGGHRWGPGGHEIIALLGRISVRTAHVCSMSGKQSKSCPVITVLGYASW